MTRVIWMAAMIYQGLWIAMLGSYVMRSDESLSAPTPDIPVHYKRIGAGMLLMALIVGALGTLGFLAQIWRQ